MQKFIAFLRFCKYSTAIKREARLTSNEGATQLTPDAFERTLLISSASPTIRRAVNCAELDCSMAINSHDCIFPSVLSFERFPLLHAQRTSVIALANNHLQPFPLVRFAFRFNQLNHL